jgi:hypothetical protein
VICRSTNNSVEAFIKIGSYFTLPDGEPKRYYQRRHLPSFVLEKNKCALLNLVDYIGAKIIWGSKQYITLWRYLPDDVAIEINLMNNFLSGLNSILRVELCVLMLKLRILMGHCNFLHLNVGVTQK